MKYIDQQLDQNNNYIIILKKQVEDLNIKLYDAKKDLEKAIKVESSLNRIKQSM